MIESLIQLLEAWRGKGLHESEGALGLGVGGLVSPEEAPTVVYNTLSLIY